MSIKEKYSLDERQYQEVLGRTADSLELEKTALSETQKAFLYPVAAGAASAALSYGVPAAVEAVRASRIRSNRDKYIANMKKVHPDMKEIPKNDLHIAYNSMAIHTPDVLRDPLMGGQTLKRMARHRMADVNALNEISRLRGTRPLDQALQTATQAFATGVGTGITEIRTQQKADADAAYRTKMDNLRIQMDREKMKLEKDKFGYTQRKDDKLFKYKKSRDDAQDVYKKDRDQKADAQVAVANAFKRKDQKLQADKFDYSKTRDNLSDKRYKEEQKYKKDQDRRNRRQQGREYDLKRRQLGLQDASFSLAFDKEMRESKKPIIVGTNEVKTKSKNSSGRQVEVVQKRPKQQAVWDPIKLEYITKSASANLNDVVSMLRYRNS
tara:strand:+ start:2413 stop:3558 length:1146 start_codon:yes stop_codon:yes gene_type:complete